MTTAAVSPLPAWQPQLDALRGVGLDAVIEACSPGWWYLRIALPDGAEVYVGSHDRDDDEDIASIPMDGPAETYLAYRQHLIDGGEHAIQSIDSTSDGNSMHDLLFAVAGAIVAEWNDYRVW
jgi:hypothetical protein